MEKTKTTTKTKTTKKKATKPVKSDKRNFRDNAITHVVIHFGGTNGFARAIEQAPNTVQYWIEAGRIPDVHAKKVVAAMKARCGEVVRAATVGEVLRP
jgi:hypothetical protein